MTESDNLTERQMKAIPFLVASATIEEGCKRAKISRETYYQWVSHPPFIEELRRQRDLVIGEAFGTLKANLTKAVDVLVGLLETKNENLKRFVANDILGHVLKAKELVEIEERLSAVERIIEQQNK